MLEPFEDADLKSGSAYTRPQAPTELSQGCARTAKFIIPLKVPESESVL